VFDFGVHDGVAFLTMELLEGETLGQRLRRASPLSTDVALPIVEQLVAALEAAHAARIIHRDFKSDNVILLPADGGSTRAVVTDFGLARVHSNPHADDRMPDSSPGRFIGTLGYMAPEQIDAGIVTPATDIYALGVVLYEMVTGRLPFTDRSPMKAAFRRLTERPISPRRLVPGLSPAWEAAILRCLETEPSKRFQSARAVLQSLGWRPPLRRRLKKVLVPSLLALVAFAVGRPFRSDARGDALPLSTRAVPVPAVMPSAPLPPVDASTPNGAAANGRDVHVGKRRAQPNRHPRSHARDRSVTPASAIPEGHAPRPLLGDGADELLDPRDDDLMIPFQREESR
jgi:serine/threonine protein kinase